MSSPTLAGVYDQVAKAHATRKLAGRGKWRGCDISIEHQIGGVRKGTDKNGVSWQTEMKAPYGYFRGTQAEQHGDLGDSDHIDCFLCGDQETDTVYVVHIVDPESGRYDEDKLMLNASSAREAYDVFSQHYDRPERYFGAMTELSADDVAAHIKGGRENWEKPLVPRVRAKVALQRSAMSRTQKAMEEERDWKRAMVQKGEPGGADWLEDLGDVVEHFFAEASKAGIAPLENEHGEIDYDEPLSMAQIGLGHLTSKAEGVTDGEQKRRDHIYSEFHRLCNMSGASVMAFAASEDGKKAGLSRGEASKQGIASGRSRPKQIAHLKSIGKGGWTSGDYAIAGRIVNFISRMSGASGPLKDDKGQLTRRATSLKIWGHNPFTSTSKALAPDTDMEDVSKAISLAHDAVSKAVMTVAPSQDGRRLIRIQPSWEAIDLQNEYVAKQVIRDAWAYYEQAGNIDLEHLTKKGGETFEEYAAALKTQGFEIPEAHKSMGRMYYEIGRPVKGSFDPEACSFVGEIYKNEVAADWFWSTLTSSTPRAWKPSIGGAARYVDAVVQNVDPAFHLDVKQQVKSMKMFRWNNIGLTLEPVCHWVPPVEVIQDTAVYKALSPHQWDRETLLANIERNRGGGR